MFLEHTADVKFRAEGSSLEELFRSCTEALNETIRGDIEILEQVEREFEIKGKDLNELLYSFLEEFLVMLDSEGFLVARVKEIEIENLRENGYKLKCVVVGDKADNYVFTNDVKAVTYSEMFVREVEPLEGIGNGEQGIGKWECQVVLDV